MPAGPPPNPYIIDQPLENDTAFFGREDIIQEVERTLRYPNHVSVILAGQRQIGKTSLLLALARRLPAPPSFLFILTWPIKR
jgi:AAA+ ATPase superfamily predicted ATPase